MDCSICLEQIQEDQKSTTLELCQHVFHESCLEPWLLTKSSCPNCRGPIQNEEHILSQERQRKLNELDKVYLTYTLFTWVLQTFNGLQFRKHFHSIHSFLSRVHWNSTRPIAFSMTPRNRASLTAIKALRGYCISREQTLFCELYPEEAHRVIHRNPRNVQIRQDIQQQLSEFARTLL